MFKPPARQRARRKRLDCVKKAMKNFIKPLKIGALVCPSNLVLSPMAGITDAPFRILCLKGGCGLVCAEMVSANALKFGNFRSLKMLKIGENEHPLSMQVFGGCAETIALACKMAEERGADIIDINAGCPVKKINKAGAGSALMKDPAKIGQIVAAAVKAVKTPVTLKTRISLNRTDIIGPLIAKIAQDNGASAITIHARAAADFHNGNANLKALEECRKAVSIPVIGNGGVCCAREARDFFNVGCDGVMIGRGALGNPFVFSDIIGETGGVKKTELTALRRLEIFRDLTAQNVAFYGEITGVKRSKKTVGYWIKGFDGSSRARADFVLSETFSRADEILSAAIKRLAA
jgi:nifR3 family TIM-barrel protein